MHRDVKFDFTADLTGIGDRSVRVICGSTASANIEQLYRNRHILKFSSGPLNFDILRFDCILKITRNRAIDRWSLSLRFLLLCLIRTCLKKQSTQEREGERELYIHSPCSWSPSPYAWCTSPCPESSCHWFTTHCPWSPCCCLDAQNSFPLSSYHWCTYSASVGLELATGNRRNC